MLEPLKVVEADDFLSSVKLPNWVVEGFLPDKGLVLLTGDAYAGKTFFSLEMAVAVSQGLQFMNKYNTVQQNVLFVGEDSPDWDVWSQLTKLLVNRKDDEGQPILKRKLNQLGFVVHQGASLANDVQADRIQRAVDSHGAGLVIFDSLRDFHDNDENDSGQMKVVMKRIMRIRETGAAVLLIHHSGKPSKDGYGGIHKARGSSTIGQKADAHLHLTHAPRTGYTHVAVPKARALMLPDLTYQLVADQDSAEFVVVGTDTMESPDDKIILGLTNPSGWSIKEAIPLIAARHPKATVASARMLTHQAIMRLMDRKLVVRETRGWYRVLPLVNLTQPD